MDYQVDLNNLTLEELQDEYTILRQRYSQLRLDSEADAQRIHELKRNLDTAIAAESYLVQELEQLTASNSSEQPSQQSKHEVDTLRRRNNELAMEFATCQKNCEELQSENEELRKQLEEAKRESSSTPILFQTTQQIEHEQQLEKENLELLNKLEECRENTVRFTMAIAEREKNMEILREQLNCMEENMRSKRTELDEMTQLLESTQEQLMEANSKIAMLTASPNNNDRKGNSLFAEVDDQRQAMKQLLAAQKKSYLHMKKVFNESEHEIRRLKRENSAMHTELHACSSIFCSAEKMYQEKLNERIRLLMNQNEDLEKKLSWTQDRLKELANNKGVVWLDSMLNFCKQETAELKKQLHSVRIHKATLEEQLRNSQQELARWRFESLKSRCILLDRENLLTENKIHFKSIAEMEFNICQKQIEAARPRIISVWDTEEPIIKNTSTSFVDQILESSYLDSKENIKPIHLNTLHENPNELEKHLKQENSRQSLTHDIEHSEYKDICSLNHQPEPSSINRSAETHIQPEHNSADLNIKTEKGNPEDHISFDLSEKLLNSHLKERNPKVEDLNLKDIKEIKPLIDSKTPQSILCKTQDPFGKENQKSVKWSTENSIIPHKYPSDSSNSYSKATVKQIRTKSNVIVRRIVVKPKQES